MIFIVKRMLSPFDINPVELQAILLLFDTYQSIILFQNTFNHNRSTPITRLVSIPRDGQDINTLLIYNLIKCFVWCQINDIFRRSGALEYDLRDPKMYKNLSSVFYVIFRPFWPWASFVPDFKSRIEINSTFNPES